MSIVRGIDELGMPIELGRDNFDECVSIIDFSDGIALLNQEFDFVLCALSQALTSMKQSPH